jgi:hypothetical protein
MQRLYIVIKKMNKPIITILISCFFIFSFLSCNQKKERKVEVNPVAHTEIRFVGFTEKK